MHSLPPLPISCPLFEGLFLMSSDCSTFPPVILCSALFLEFLMVKSYLTTTLIGGNIQPSGDVKNKPSSLQVYKIIREVQLFTLKRLHYPANSNRWSGWVVFTLLTHTHAYILQGSKKGPVRSSGTSRFWCRTSDLPHSLAQWARI